MAALLRPPNYLAAIDEHVQGHQPGHPSLHILISANKQNVVQFPYYNIYVYKTL